MAERVLVSMLFSPAQLSAQITMCYFPSNIALKFTLFELLSVLSVVAFASVVRFTADPEAFYFSRRYFKKRSFSSFGQSLQLRRR